LTSIRPATAPVAVKANRKSFRMKTCIKYLIYTIIFWSLIGFSGNVAAQRPTRVGPAPAQEIAAARSVVMRNMDSIRAHRIYIYKMGLDNPLLLPQYKKWIKKYPQNINIPLALGTVYFNAEMPQAREFLLRAAAIDPKNANIWFMLSGDAFNRGQASLQREYIKKATFADSSDAGYGYAYLTTFRDGNQDEYKKKVFEFAKRFPSDERGAQALYWLGEDAMDTNEKIKYFEQLRKLYPPKKFEWSASGMIGLADAYLQQKPENAYELANYMGDSADWQIRKQVALQLIKINELQTQKNYEAAVIELDKMTLPKFNYVDEFIALKKASLQAMSGDVETAYRNLAEKMAKLPTDRLNEAITSYGKELGKSDDEIKNDIKATMITKASAAYPFKLGVYGKRDSLSLNDLKGKVILLTFWFPGCGPCRAEFPYFQSVINKFKSEDVAYLGINVFPDQDSYVVPFLKNTKFSFVPLRGNPEFAEKNFNVTSEPENFLIDKEDKIIFKNFTIDQKNQRSLELMIKSLL